MAHAYSTRRHDTHARTHMTHARTHTHIQLHSRARTLAQTHTRSTRSLHRPACCLQSCTVVESAADACLDPSIDKSPQSALALLHCSHNKQTTAANQWTLQLLVSDARTECTGSLIPARLARAGYRFALFSDAQGTPSLRIRVGQRGQGTRTSAARRGSVVAAASIAQRHRRLVAR